MSEDFDEKAEQNLCMCTGCQGCSNADEDQDHVELTMQVIVQIVVKICEGRLNGLSDKVINDEITLEIGNLYFGQCAVVDDAMFDERDRRYWRGAYGYPKDGDHVCENMIAENCGFFTFGIRVIEEEEISG